MPKASSYLPWNKVLGSTLLLGTPAFLWATALGIGRALPELPWQAALAISLVSTPIFLVWADRSSGSRPLRIGYLAVIALGLIAVMLGSASPAAASAVLPSGLFTVALGSASLVWQRERTPSSWQQKALWAFILAAAPSVVTGAAALASLGPPSLFFLALLMVVGVTLCLADNEATASTNRRGKRLASITASAFFLGWLVSSLAPGASSAASWGIRGLLHAIRSALIEILKPVGWLVEWLIGILLLVLRKSTEQENPFQGIPGGDLIQETEEYVTPTAMKVLGWLVAVALALAFIRLLWTMLERYSSRRGAPEVAETRSSEWSTSKAARWAAAKARELVAPLADLLSGGFGRARNPVDPLVSMYSEFLSLAAEAGHSRTASETPLEFARALASRVPEASSQIASISSLFSSRFYARREASPEELSSMRQDLRLFRLSLSLDRKDQVS